jgi:HEPN domain-containing protein
MIQEVESWWKQALSDLKAARHSLSSKDFDWASFQAHQAVEKSLKAIYIKEFKELKRVHDLTFLGKKLKLPENLMVFCGKLNRIYTETRYPEGDGKIPSDKFSLKDAKYFIEKAGEIMSWLEKKL